MQGVSLKTLISGLNSLKCWFHIKSDSKDIDFT